MTEKIAKCPICDRALNIPQDHYDRTVVKKPWGYEYLCYENEHVGIWLLHIEQDQQTSMHCHPKKTTGLVVLDGEAEISFLSSKMLMMPGSKTMIRRGMFHSTYALTETDLLEVETPKDKHDLIRLKDEYGRALQGYEDHTHESPRKDSNIWIPDTPLHIMRYDEQTTIIDLCKLTECNLDELVDSPIIFVEGGLVNIAERYVIQPGDVVTGKVVKQLLGSFEPRDNTEVITVETRWHEDQ